MHLNKTTESARVAKVDEVVALAWICVECLHCCVVLSWEIIG